MKKIYLTLVVGLFLLPTILISQTVSISGQVTRHNGDPVAGIEVNCDGNVTTDLDGNFEFTDVSLNYFCDLTPNGLFDKYEEVTILDGLVIQQHILQINNIINWYQLSACDVNNSQSITALDLVRVHQLALRLDTNVQNDWKFVDEAYVFTNPFTTAPGYISVNATDTITDADFIAIKKGDPAISSDYMPAPPSAPSPIFSISNESFQAGDDVEFEITVEDFSNIVGFQQTFKWDPNVLSFESISELPSIVINFNDAELALGLLPTLATTNLNQIQLQDGEVIMTLNFKALADISSPIEVLSFSDEIMSRQVVWMNDVDAELFIVDAGYMNGEGTTGVVNAPSGLKSFQIFPNPVEDNFHVKALLQNEEEFEILIVNVLGQNIFSKKFDQKELFLNIDFGAFPAGTYFLSLKTADGIQTESFIKN